VEKQKLLLNQVLQSQMARLSHRDIRDAICYAYHVNYLYDVSFAATRVLVVAAGNGSRFHGTEPKVLARGKYDRPLLLRILDVVAPFDPHPVVVVRREIEPLIQSAVVQDMRHTPSWLLQECQRGTGNAVLTAEAEFAAFHGSLIIVWGDMGALSERLIFTAEAVHELSHSAITLPTKWCHHPYVALVRNAEGRIMNVLQERNGHHMPEYGEQDCGVFIVKSPDVFRWLHKVYSSDHADGAEYDFLSLLRSSLTTQTSAVCLGAEWESQGVNTLQDLVIADGYTHKIAQQASADLARCQILSELLEVLVWTTVQMDTWKEVEQVLCRLAVDQQDLLKALPLGKRSVIEKWLSVARKVR